MEKMNKNMLHDVEFSDIQKAPLPIEYMDSDIVFMEKLESLPELCSVKLKFNVFVFCLNGRLELDVAETHYVVHEGETFICPSGMIIDNVMVSPDFKFTILSLTDRIIQSLLSTNMDIWNRAVYYRREHIGKMNTDVESRLFVDQFMGVVRAILENKANPFREEMVRSMLQVMLLGFCARKKFDETETLRMGEITNEPSQGRILFNRFMELLKNESVRHRPVYYYADKLCISSKYLSHVCKQVCGKTANDLIQGLVVEDITRYLKNTTLSVKEIASVLGFPNISFFGKYVKAHFGVSPNEYRKQLYAGKN